jgi:HAMP domain-containing protein
VVLPDGQFLLVAHDAEQLEELEELLLRSFGWMLAVAVPLALGGGVFMSLVTLRCIEAINRVSDETRRGDLWRRVPHAGTEDEFDRLAVNINATLDAIEHLTEGLRKGRPTSRTICARRSAACARSSKRRAAKASSLELRAAVDHAIEQTDSILETLEVLLRIAQIEAGVRRSGFKQVDLSNLVRLLVEVYETVAEDAGHRIEARIQQGIAFRAIASS